MLHCPKCDAIFETHDDACAETACPRCGGMVRTADPIRSIPENPARRATTSHDDFAHFSIAADSRRRGFSLTGRPGILHWTKNVAVRLVRSACPDCGRNVGKGMSVCPQCGRALKKNSAPAPREFGRVLRKMLFAAIVFIGLPAAVIVFVLVVCAPEEDNVGANAPRQAPAGTVGQRVLPPSAEPQKPHRSPLSVLRSMRAWLRGAEHGGGGAPAKTPLEKPGDGGNDPHVPPVGPGNGEQVKPDPTR